VLAAKKALTASRGVGGAALSFEAPETHPQTPTAMSPTRRARFIATT
jgi:hypothetical protein